VAGHWRITERSMSKRFGNGQHKAVIKGKSERYSCPKQANMTHCTSPIDKTEGFFCKLTIN